MRWDCLTFNLPPFNATIESSLGVTLGFLAGTGEESTMIEDLFAGVVKSVRQQSKGASSLLVLALERNEKTHQSRLYVYD